MKKILTLLACMALLVGVVSSAQAKAPSTHARTPGSAAKVAKMIKRGKLKKVTARQRSGLRVLQAPTGKLGLSNARTASVAGGVGTYDLGFHQESGRLWYDLRYSVGYYSSNYYWYAYYKNWYICPAGTTSGSTSTCADTHLYDVLSYVWYYGTWYYSGWSGPYQS